MNLLKFLPVKMSALVFRSIKHMSLTFFFFLRARLLRTVPGVLLRHVETDTDPDQRRTDYSVLTWCPYEPGSIVTCFWETAHLPLSSANI